GESLVTIYSKFEDVSKVKERLYESIAISKEKIEKPTLIYKEIME
ncbi:pyrimidine-nucleoside phosphorylase, partial [Peribacillus frigoritolerans]|nr:pyrimidine-nucleoside phosphorylase [Peribacillus frigoritolerans]